GHGGVDTQSFQVVVNDGLPNARPIITSQPITTAPIGQPYTYTVAAGDPDGDPISFFLTQAPAGMAIDRRTGAISWTPTGSQLGPNDVTLRVLDSHGGFDTQSFQVIGIRDTVQAPPRIVSTAAALAEVGRLYRYDVSAIDPNLDALIFDLPVHPAGMAVDSS